MSTTETAVTADGAAGEATRSLTAAERRLQRAQLAGDVEALDELLDDGLVFVGGSGERLTKAADLATHREGALRLTRLDETDLAVQVWGDTGVTRAALVVGGEAQGAVFEAGVVYTRTWTFRDGRWVMVAAHASFLA